MNIDKPINVLFIDDDVNVRESLIGEARRKRILIRGVDNLDDGILELRSNNRIKFIILDGKGFRRRGQVKGTESSSFAIKAAQEIPRLAKELDRYLPFCFFTGFADLASDLSGADHIVIDKNEENATEKLFEHIWRTYQNSDEGRLKQQYEPLFNSIDILSNSQAEHDLITFLTEKDARQGNRLKHTARLIRPIMEAIFAKIAELDREMLPDGLQIGNQQSLSNAIWHLGGKPQWSKTNKKYDFGGKSYIPFHLWMSIDFLQKALSTVAMHDYPASISYYTLSSYGDILADLLLWFSDFMRNRA
ncbi:hypothetical protein [Spirosoma validum]|uniref:Uncharacterized protein n=1 Tax=Spirosoma validum TaxID=2771355 RepID=A0A927B7F8_9BACT|nr:hypothetical protein [Spirosoma validum]MBD2757116.1 hypothetical protein [Spirosoma validum]